MPLDRGPHRRSIPFPEDGAPLDVREQERDGAARQVTSTDHRNPPTPCMMKRRGKDVNRILNLRSDHRGEFNEVTCCLSFIWLDVTASKCQHSRSGAPGCLKRLVRVTALPRGLPRVAPP